MSTIKQVRALEKMVENGGNVSQAMLEVGYSLNTAKTPQKLTESRGFIALCEELGLTDNLLVNALVEDIKTKKGNRKAELELGFKIKGRLIQKTDITSGELPIPILSLERKKEIDDAINSICNYSNNFDEIVRLYEQ
ncbi:MAG: hypothetical protein WCI93_03680 [bacterium]